MNIVERQTKIVDEFKKISTWEDRYKKIIEIGKNLPEMPIELKVDENKIKGCQSQVWIHAKLSAENKIKFTGDSDALIVRGLVGLLMQIYSESTPEEILKVPPHFIKEIGFEGNLSPSRANGLNSMIKQIMNYAMAFNVMIQMKR